MKYVAKRPAVEAIQFTGLKSVHGIKFLSRAHAIRYEDNVLSGPILYLHLQVNGNQNFIEVQRSQYVVRDRGQTIVMSEEEFESKYELVEPVNEPKIGFANINAPFATAHAVLDPGTSHSQNNFYATGEAAK